MRFLKFDPTTQKSQSSSTISRELWLAFFFFLPHINKTFHTYKYLTGLCSHVDILIQTSSTNRLTKMTNTSFLHLKLSTNPVLPWILSPLKSNYVLKHITIKWPLQFLRARIFLGWCPGISLKMYTLMSKARSTTHSRPQPRFPRTSCVVERFDITV